MRRTVIASISAVSTVLLSVAGCGSVNRQAVTDVVTQHPFENPSVQTVTDTRGDVKITSTKRANDPYSGPELQTEYTVTNPTEGKVSYTITFEYLDRNGTRLSEDYGSVESLSGHQASHESLTLWGTDLRGVTSVHVIDVMRDPA